MKAKVAFLLLLACLIFVEVCESRGRGGSSRGGSRSRSSRSRSSGGSSAPKITKSTPITPKSRKTAVIRNQATFGSRSNTARNVLVGYLAYRYLVLSNAPVYRRDYEMYGRRSVQIPEERAVRITSTETRMLDHHNDLCLSEVERSTKQQVPADASVVHENATIQYDNEEPIEFDGIDQTFTLRDQQGVDFKIVTRTQYNTTLVEGKNCFVVEERVEGTIIHMYETNPDGVSTVVVNAWLSLLTVLLTFVWSGNP